MKRIEFFLILISILCFVSCADDQPIIDKHKVINNSEVLDAHYYSNDYEENEMNTSLEILAVAYANALQQIEVRNVIKKEVMKQFDGDYNVLHRNVIEERIGSSNLDEILKLNISKSNLNKSLTLTNCTILDSILSAYDNLQISIPVHCETWNENEYIPKVIFLPTNFSEKTFSKIKAYDALGNFEWVSTIDEPDVPYIVIGKSERVDIYGNLLFEDNTNFKSANLYTNLNIGSSLPDIQSVTYGNPFTHFIKWNLVTNSTGYEIWRSSGGSYQQVGTTGMSDNEFVDEDTNMNIGTRYYYKIRAITSSGYSGWGESMSIVASERTKDKQLECTKLYISKSRLKAVESWLSGAPEIVLYICSGVGTSPDEYTASLLYTSSVMEPNRRNDIQDKWWNIFGGGLKTNQWNVNDNNNPLMLNFVWVEQDWEDGLLVPVNLKIVEPKSGLEFTIDEEYTIPDSKGELISCQSVYWWDSKSKEYFSEGFGFDLSEY
ncbi:MAG: fibronectin type III domain-containing protein [Bacteroidales bacterium]|nr:fibronectin type III domain-containing protein [Bacteroidales bacterium]